MNYSPPRTATFDPDARVSDDRDRIEAEAMFRRDVGLVDIARELGMPFVIVARWRREMASRETMRPRRVVHLFEREMP